ncbi:MAG: nicotinate-nucleotide adenylyltransferase [Gammaproteobacteria bacterium]|nr:nicotinate-nucleotide adenylyltransferase [Gammaproteobacteria bacterium]
MSGPEAVAAGAPGPIGLLGGTFDPVHNGHLRAALEALEALELAEMRLLPLNTPGHRPPPLASAAHRCAMLDGAVRPPLVVDRLEIERGGTTYTVDTLEHLRVRFPRRSLCLVIGRDAFYGLPSWHRPEAVLELAHIVVAARPEVVATALPGLDELVGNAQSARVADLHHNTAGRVYFLDIPRLPIASSDLRERLRGGRSIRHLVPDSVDDYIRNHRLYQA